MNSKLIVKNKIYNKIKCIMSKFQGNFLNLIYVDKLCDKLLMFHLIFGYNRNSVNNSR